MPAQTSNPWISVIVLNYNGERFLDECLKSIEAQSYANCEVIVVDNASTDGSLGCVARQLRAVRIIRNDGNLGYARANNRAVQETRGEYLFFLNVDTRLERNCLQELSARIGSDEAMYAPLVMNYVGSEKLSCGVGCDILGFPVPIEDQQQPFYVDGAALVISKRLFLQLGMFDETSFLFQEDIDLAWRALLTGHDIIRVPEATVYHVSGGILEGGAVKGTKYTTSTVRRYLGERNSLRNVLKNYYWSTLLWILPLYILVNLAEFLFFLVLCKPRFSLCYIRAYLWNVAVLRDTLRKRSVIQAGRKVTDKKILSRMYVGSGKLLLLTRVGVPTSRN